MSKRIRNNVQSSAHKIQKHCVILGKEDTRTMSGLCSWDAVKITGESSPQADIQVLLNRYSAGAFTLDFLFVWFFLFAFPSYISGVHHFWVRFLRMWPFFFNPTIKVVTFRLRGWCMLGVFLLPAFTCLGHERQDLLSPCDEMHVCTD